MDSKYIETAITLARLYGIAETLHPWSYIANERFPHLIRSWADEYVKGEGEDIVSFFESKIQGDKGE